MKKIILNNLLITLIFFFVLEIFLRTFGLSDLRGHGNELKKKQTNVETTVFGKKVYLDSYGYRVPNKEFKYQNNLKKIIFIGDSVLFGSGVNEEDTFVGKLRKNNNNFSFINAGIIGNNIDEILIDIKKNNELFSSSNFYIVLTLDDILSTKKDNLITRTENNDNITNKIKKNAFFNQVNLFLRSKSYTYMWIKGVTTKPSERYFFESLDYYHDENKIKSFEEVFVKIKKNEELKKLTIKFIILPYEYQTRDSCSKNYLLPQKKILKILKNNNLKFVDLTKSFCDFKSVNKLYINFDPVHLSVKGHNLVYKHLNQLIN